METTNLSQVECSEQSGTLFLLAVLTMQVEGWHLLERHFADLEAVLRTMECLLCFEAWLEQFTFWDVNDTTGEADKAEAAIASLMRLIVKYLPQVKSNSWRVSKFHEIKHAVRFIGVFGAPATWLQCIPSRRASQSPCQASKPTFTEEHGHH